MVGSNWQQWQQAMGTNAGALASMFAQGADALAAAAVGGIDRLSDVAGSIDSRGEAVHAVSLLHLSLLLSLLRGGSLRLKL